MLKNLPFEISQYINNRFSSITNLKPANFCSNDCDLMFFVKHLCTLLLLLHGGFFTQIVHSRCRKCKVTGRSTLLVPVTVGSVYLTLLGV